MSRTVARFLRGNLIALIALFIALGGTSYAATQLPRNSVGPKQLQKSAVTSAKIKSSAVSSSKLAERAVTTRKVADDSITGAKVLESSLGKVPAAANADTVGGVGAGVFGSTQIYLGTTFRPRNSSQTYSYGFNGAIATTSNSDRFMVPVWLPQGATVTGMTMYYSNASSGSAGITWLTSYPGDGSGSTDLVSISAPTATGQGSADAVMPATPMVIDNTSSAYMLIWNGATSADWRLCSVKLTYTLPGAAAAAAGTPAGGAAEQQPDIPPSE